MKVHGSKLLAIALLFLNLSVPGLADQNPFLLNFPSPLKPLVIVGPDDRVRVKDALAETTNAVGLIIFARNGRHYGCTGTLIDKVHVLTAGHCLNDAKGHWSTDILFAPAVNGDTEHPPFGVFKGSALTVLDGWAKEEDHNFDIGMFTLDGNPNVIPMPFEKQDDDFYNSNTKFYVAGYPGDKPMGTLWRDGNAEHETLGDHLVMHSVDTWGGQSGAPLYYERTGRWILVGVHTAGENGGRNIATKLDAEMFSIVMNWMNQKPL